MCAFIRPADACVHLWGLLIHFRKGNQRRIQSTLDICAVFVCLCMYGMYAWCYTYVCMNLYICMHVCSVRMFRMVRWKLFAMFAQYIKPFAFELKHSRADFPFNDVWTSYKILPKRLNWTGNRLGCISCPAKSNANGSLVCWWRV